MLLLAGGMPLAELEKNNPREKVRGMIGSKRASGRHSHFEDIDSEVTVGYI